MKRICQYSILLILMITVNSAYGQPVIQDQLKPIELHNLKLHGILGQRFDNNLVHRVKNRDDLEIFLSYYEHPEDTFRWFSGEHIGKWLINACNSYRYSRDEELKSMINECVNRLLKCQLPNGYLGSQKPGYRFFELDWNETCHVKVQDWHFDTWNHNLTMMGLLTHYEIFGDNRTLDAVKKIADLYMKTFGGNAHSHIATVYQNEEGKVDLAVTNTMLMFGSGATCAIYPFAWLYELEPNEEYMRFCNYIKSRYYSVYGPRFFLTNDPTNRQSYHRKPCEDFLNFLGFINLYRSTGSDTMLVSAANQFHQFTEQNQIVKNQGLSLDYLCDICPFAIFALRMLELTGDAQYANILEPVVYNSINAHDEGNSCGVAGNVSFDGTPGYRCMVKDRSSFCCYSMNSMAISYFPEFFYMKSDDGDALAINFYESSTLTTDIKGTSVQIEQETLYPMHNTINIEINPETAIKFDVRLRVPMYCDGATVKVNGKSVKSEIIPGEYLILSREWKNEDRITMTLDMKLKQVDYAMQTLVPANLKRYNISKDPGTKSVQYGSITLVYDKNLNNGLEEFSIKSKDGIVDVELVKNSATLSGYAFKSKSTDNKDIILVPYAEGGRVDHKFKTWINIQDLNIQ